MQGFLEALDERVLVCDGAMGTVLYARGIFLNRSFDELNLTQPDLVRAVHEEYVRAGADVIETNTFGANAFKLSAFDLADLVPAINREGARLARRAADGRAYVAGAIGPLGVRIAPWGRTSPQEATAAFTAQVDALIEGGVDLFILETFADLPELELAVRAVRARSSLPIVAQMTTGDDGRTPDGTPPEVFAPALAGAGADVVGLNCSVGPAAMLETIETMAVVSGARLAAQPNAGRPRDVDGRNLYLSSPEYMASYARRFVAAGARLVGGCCGTTPDHTRRMVEAVRAAAPGGARTARASSPAREAAPQPAIERRAKSNLARALDDARFAVVVEIASPRGLDLTASVDRARAVHLHGAAAVSVPDYPRSGARASALALAALLERSGIEALLHYTCRDRTLIGMQADLVGAHALGVRNVLLTTGSPERSGNYPERTSVFEVDALGLLHLVGQLNRGLDVAGQPLASATSFHVGVTVNPYAPNPDEEWQRLAKKVEAGAEFIMTPPVLDLEGFDRVLPRLRASGLPVLAGVAALEGLRHAEVLASEVVGVRASDDLLQRLRQADDDAREAQAVTAETVRWLRTRCEGVVITTLHGRSEALDVLWPAVGSQR